jgi:glycosyltransferase involved in cell wall biosynthesis
MRHLTAALVVTFNAANQPDRSWVAHILRQSRLPDEILILDLTPKGINPENFRDLSVIPMIRVVHKPRALRGQALNAVIRLASSELIVRSEPETLPGPDWLSNLVSPFERDDTLQVCAEGENIIGSPPQIDPLTHLSWLRGLAFTRQAWEAAGFYPQWPGTLGSDLLFITELLHACPRWMITSSTALPARPDRLYASWRENYQIAQSMGEVRMGGQATWHRLWQIPVFGMMVVASVASMVTGLHSLSWGWIIFGLAAGLVSLAWLSRTEKSLIQLIGYLQGTRLRKAADRRRQEELKGVFFILSGIPIDDTGGGARCTQIALELLHQDFWVVFINKFPKYERADLGLQIVHPNLVTTSLARFKIAPYIQENHDLLRQKPIGVLVEFPLQDFLPVIQALKACGSVTIYDLLDAWDTSLGAAWYAQEIEHAIINASEVLVATAPVLAERLEGMSGRAVTLLPNAVNLRLFDPLRTCARPADLPWAEWTVIYFGALWGEWFDWQLLVEAARQYSNASFVMIGDYHGQCPEKLPNLHFLGLKAQTELPAYLTYSTVAMVPWKVSPITLAVSPIKVYEYLAMRKPVVAPDLPLLSEIPGVLCSPDRQRFIQNLEQARHLAVNIGQISGLIDAYLQHNSWQTRVEMLINFIAPKADDIIHP